MKNQRRLRNCDSCFWAKYVVDANSIYYFEKIGIDKKPAHNK